MNDLSWCVGQVLRLLLKLSASGLALAASLNLLQVPSILADWFAASVAGPAALAVILWLASQGVGLVLDGDDSVEDQPDPLPVAHSRIKAPVAD